MVCELYLHGVVIFFFKDMMCATICLFKSARKYKCLSLLTIWMGAQETDILWEGKEG